MDSQKHIETITVVDPCHPLYDRTFRVAVPQRSPREPVSVAVEYRDGIILRIAVAATDYAYCPSPSPRSRITAVALKQLVGLLTDWRDVCASQPARSGNGSRKRTASRSAEKS